METLVFFVYVFLCSLLYLIFTKSFKKIYLVLYNIFLLIVGIYTLQKNGRLKLNEMIIIISSFILIENMISYFLLKYTKLKHNYFFYLLSLITTTFIIVILLSFVIVVVGILTGVKGL
ncbi:hypothetical protein AR438_17245 [Chryseobacterium aquaticum]|uniref:Uncharacterized protein n=1 Tax=Chryseobacterium aquaticum TaxID=452084 RepID=A0A0Q3P2X1_9FLAO|nr:hypothetical protein AR438_17245 [Chryseobacterium aquaticum]